jgi:hypothetical protein
MLSLFAPDNLSAGARLVPRGVEERAELALEVKGQIVVADLSGLLDLSLNTDDEVEQDVARDSQWYAGISHDKCAPTLVVVRGRQAAGSLSRSCGKLRIFLSSPVVMAWM